MYEHLLEIKDLRTSFNVPSGEVRSVNGISFNVDKNEVLGIVGESGSGKSVTAYSIMQILEKPGRIVGGSIKFKGQEMLNIPRRQIQKIRGEKISIIFQDSMTSLNPVWPIGSQLKECIKSHPDTPGYKAIRDRIISLKKKIKENNGDVSNLKSELIKAKKEYREYPTNRSLEMLQLVGINEPKKRLKQYPFEFSGGMLQRVMIAMALICEPELIIADEPTTALDVTIQAQILELLIAIQKKMGMGIIIITHDLGVVAQICDRINVMYAGRIVETGTCDDIFYNPKHEYTKGLINSIPKMQKKTGEKLVPIPGNPVDVFRLPNGCSFVPRCSKCMKVCLKKYPKFLDVNENHKTACFAYLEELLNEGKIDEETYKNYLDSCESGNKSFRKISLFDVEDALNKYKEAKEMLLKADKTKISKNELDILKYRVSDSKRGCLRAKTDFKNSIKNYFQSRGEKKSIDKNDVHKKIRHIIHDFSLIAHDLNQEDYNNYLSKMIICTSEVNFEITKEKVREVKAIYLKARKQHLVKLFKHDVAIHDDYYNRKIEFYDAHDALKWKIYIEHKKAFITKVLLTIYKLKRKGAN
mgnify:FL=1